MIFQIVSKLNNALKSKKKFILSQNNSFSIQLLRLLVVQGFISSVVEINSGNLLKVRLKFDSQGTSALKYIKLLSTPNKASFVSYSQLAKIQLGVGCLVISTNKGLYVTQDCLKYKIGGNALCFIS
jgi:ribosomal protein S8